MSKAPFIFALGVTFAGALEVHSTTHEPAALRVREDSAHGLRWELRWDAAYAYDAASGRLARRVRLGDATMIGAEEAGPPDMVVDRAGALIVSSNAQPVLWLIGPALRAERRELALDADADKDFGFSALAWSADGHTLYAASAVMGTLWRVDLAHGTASKVALSEPIRGTCGLAAEARRDEGAVLLATICATRGVERITISADLNSGEVTKLRMAGAASTR